MAENQERTSRTCEWEIRHAALELAEIVTTYLEEIVDALERSGGKDYVEDLKQLAEQIPDLNREWAQRSVAESASPEELLPLPPTREITVSELKVGMRIARSVGGGRFYIDTVTKIVEKPFMTPRFRVSVHGGWHGPEIRRQMNADDVVTVVDAEEEGG